MGAHALGAAGYAARAVELAGGDVGAEIEWQLARMSSAVRVALSGLPALGEDRAGPLGPGLLANGALGVVIRRLQAGIAG